MKAHSEYSADEEAGDSAGDSEALNDSWQNKESYYHQQVLKFLADLHWQYGYHSSFSMPVMPGLNIA